MYSKHYFLDVTCEMRLFLRKKEAVNIFLEFWHTYQKEAYGTKVEKHWHSLRSFNSDSTYISDKKIYCGLIHKWRHASRLGERARALWRMVKSIMSQFFQNTTSCIKAFFSLEELVFLSIAQPGEEGETGSISDVIFWVCITFC